MVLGVRYEAGDVDAQEWGAPAFFFAPPASLSSSLMRPRSPPPPGSQTLDRLGSTKHPTAPVAVSSSTRPFTTTAASSGKGIKGIKGINDQGQVKGSRQNFKPAGGDPEGGGLHTISSGGEEHEVGGGKATVTAVVSETWGPEAVKVAIFGDMGTAEVDGTLDAGHTNEPPSIRTVGILKEQLGAGAQPVVGGAGGGAGQAENAAPEPQLGLVLHIGDLSYARGYDAQWDEVSRALFPFRYPVYVCVCVHGRLCWFVCDCMLLFS